MHTANRQIVPQAARVLLVAVMFIVLAGCATFGIDNRVGSKANTDLHHVVLLWLKSPTQETIDDIIRHTYDLEAIPQVRSVHVAQPIDNPRPVVDKSYHVGIIVTFDNFADLQAYGAHPIHTRFVDEHVKAHLERMVVYDF